MSIGDTRWPMPMDCREFLTRYSEYDDSLLCPTEQARFRVHLAACDSCSRYDRVLRKGRMLARQVPRVQPRSDSRARLHARLWQERYARRHAATPVLGGAAAGLAAVTVVLTAMWALALMEGESRGGTVADAADLAGGPAWTAPEPRPAVEAGWRALPVAEAVAPREWSLQRVDHRAPVTYSPLVTGPPKYRVPGAIPAGATLIIPHTLD
jgi:hypothetical protein